MTTSDPAPRALVLSLIVPLECELDLEIHLNPNTADVMEGHFWISLQERWLPSSSVILLLLWALTIGKHVVMLWTGRGRNTRYWDFWPIARRKQKSANSHLRDYGSGSPASWRQLQVSLDTDCLPAEHLDDSSSGWHLPCGLGRDVGSEAAR